MLAYYRAERVVEDVALMAHTILEASASGEDRLKTYVHFMAQFEPGGVVEMAVASDQV